MLASSAELIERRLAPGDQVLDVGGWVKPFPRADWVLDLMPYETRGEADERGQERFRRETWVVRDICDHEPWPFADDQFDFAICSHTLEDIRDPIWVCSELNRVARAGYIEVPSRIEEQTWWINGRFAGWAHHRWLIDVGDDSVEFVFKSHGIHGRPEYYFPSAVGTVLTDAERVQTLFWEGGFGYRERIFYEIAEHHDYLTSFVNERRAELMTRAPKRRGERVRRLISRSRGLVHRRAL